VNKRTITVRGSARVSAAPDWVVISFTVNSEHYDYGQCMEQMAVQTENLQKDLAAVGLERDSLKTVHFDIDTHFEKVNDRYVFRGYKAVHRLKVEFAFKKDFLNKVLRALSRTQSQASFSVSFEIKDPEPLRHKAIAEAVKNAKIKAQVLAEAAGVMVGELVHIDYSWSEIRFQSSLKYEMVTESMPSPGYDFTPQDVNVSESVTVIWAIDD
jgi:uncharacterized protein YggE